jgi:hypothetical protein
MLKDILHISTRRTAIVQITSVDGFDLCVLHNLKQLYKGMGFVTLVGTRPIISDLNVFPRGVRASEVCFVNKSKCAHVYNYTGIDMSGLDVTNPRCSFFCPSVKMFERVPRVENLVHAFPPVDIASWCDGQAGEKVKYEVVHVGTFKSAGATHGHRDGMQMEMEKMIRNHASDIWGEGWPSCVKGVRHGRLPIAIVPRIYSSSRCAIGVMYPTQRDVTFSSRFWLAPINGCTLISEPGLFAKEVPGVVVSTAFKSSLAARCDATQARDYWRKWGEESRTLIRDQTHRSGETSMRLSTRILSGVSDYITRTRIARTQKHR